MVVANEEGENKEGGEGTGGYYVSDATGYLCLFDVGRDPMRKKTLWVNSLCVSYTRY